MIKPITLLNDEVKILFVMFFTVAYYPFFTMYINCISSISPSFPLPLCVHQNFFNTFCSFLFVTSVPLSALIFWIIYLSPNFSNKSLLYKLSILSKCNILTISTYWLLFYVWVWNMAEAINLGISYTDGIILLLSIVNVIFWFKSF